MGVCGVIKLFVGGIINNWGVSQEVPVTDDQREQRNQMVLPSYNKKLKEVFYNRNPTLFE